MSKLLSLSEEAPRLGRSTVLVIELVTDLAGEAVRRPSPGPAPYATARRCALLGRSELVRRLGGISSDASTGYGARKLGDGDRPRALGAGDTPRAGETPLVLVKEPLLLSFL